MIDVISDLEKLTQVPQKILKRLISCLSYAMIDNVTGIRCKVGDVDSLYWAMRKFVEEPDLIKEMGKFKFLERNLLKII